VLEVVIPVGPCGIMTGDRVGESEGPAGVPGETPAGLPEVSTVIGNTTSVETSTCVVVGAAEAEPCPPSIEVVSDGGVGLPECALVGLFVAGQTVVDIMIISVVTCPTGQLVTVGAQEVIVYVFVAYTVDVVCSDLWEEVIELRGLDVLEELNCVELDCVELLEELDWVELDELLDVTWVDDELVGVCVLLEEAEVVAEVVVEDSEEVELLQLEVDVDAEVVVL